MSQTADLTPAARIHHFEGLGFGLFLHWGLYSHLRAGEWVWNHHKMAKEDYVTLVNKFDGADFDADAIVRFAKDAGCRYICLTTRHHDGFSLYDTRGLNTYDAPHSPAGRDLIAEFAKACEEHDMGKFFYHTTLDWWHEAFDADWDAYQQYLRDSIDILCTHYGKVDGFWFDGNWARKDRDWQEDALYDVIRAKQPEAIIVNNSSTGALGAEGHPETDVVTFEQGQPTARKQQGKYRAAEMCETINSHWGIGDFDLSSKGPAQLVESLAACRRFGANLLLNIGPTPGGAIPGYEREVFALLGRWIRICPDAIYKARPTALRCRGRDFVLKHQSTYYYFCHNVPIHGNRHLLVGEAGDGLQSVAGDLPPVRRVYWADNQEELAYTQVDERFCFEATPYPYGRQLIVRVAVIETAI